MLINHMIKIMWLFCALLIFSLFDYQESCHLRFMRDFMLINGVELRVFVLCIGDLCCFWQREAGPGPAPNQLTQGSYGHAVFAQDDCWRDALLR